MEKQTVVLVTYRDHTRDSRHAGCVDYLRNAIGMLVLEVTGSAHIDIARSDLATSAMDLGADVVVFIDSDIVFDPADVERLADVARTQRAVVGAAYSKRVMGGGLSSGAVPKDDHVVFFEGGDLYDVAGTLSMGFTAIHREVFEKIAELPGYERTSSGPHLCHPFFQKIIIDGHWLYEDAAFIEAARRVGSPVYLDTRLRVTHLGTHEFRIEDCCHQPRADQPTLKVRAKRGE